MRLDRLAFVRSWRAAIERWRSLRLRGGLFVSFGAAILLSLAVANFIHPRAYAATAAAALLLAGGIVLPWLMAHSTRATWTAAARRGQVGKPLRLRLRAQSRWWWPTMGVSASIGDGAQSIDWLTRRPSSQEIEVMPLRRGVFPPSPPRVVSGFPFGLWSSSSAAYFDEPVLVWPEIVSLSAGNRGQARSRAAGRRADQAEETLVGTRPYRRGEALRKVHWKQTARHRQLIVCEREAPKRGRVRLLVDTSAAAHPQPASLEKALSIAASIASEVTEQGKTLSIHFDRRGWRDIDARLLNSLLDALALFAVEDRAGGDTVFNSEGRSRQEARLIVVTTSTGMAHLPPASQQQRQCLVIDNAASRAVPAPHFAGEIIPLDDPDHAALRRAWNEVAHA